MKLKPVNQRLIAKLYVPDEVKSQTLILTLKEPPKDRFIVQEVCENNQGICEGDMVICERYDALERVIDGESFYIIAIDKVVAIVGGA